MTKLMGVEFAPFDVPVERRLQTFAVLYWASSFMFMGFWGSVACVLVLLLTDYWYIPLFYFVWYWYDRKTCERGGRRSSWVRNWQIWKHMRDYFPARLVKTVDLDPKKNYVCGYHPHGVLCAGAFTSFCTEALDFSGKFPDIHPSLLTLHVQFQFPLYREFVMSTGACCVSRNSVHWLLSNQDKGNMVIIVVGGAAEALDAHPGSDVRLTLLPRKGFVKIAITHGASLLPIFSFGENDLFEQYPNPEGSFIRKMQRVVTKIVGISPPLFHGRGVFQYTFGYVPYRKPMDVVVGKPIDVEKNENPTGEEINRYHKLYVESLIKLFDEHKVYYDHYKNKKLIIV